MRFYFGINYGLVYNNQRESIYGLSFLFSRHRGKRIQEEISLLASRLYSPTLREIPAEAVVISHKYMLKAGMIRKIVGGIYVYMPLAWRTLQKIEAIIREEMNKAGSQEIQMPIIQPAEIWQQTGRWAVYGDEMFRLQDRHGRQYCLAPTHEEMTPIRADAGP